MVTTVPAGNRKVRRAACICTDRRAEEERYSWTVSRCVHDEEKKKIKSLSFRSLMDEMHENLMKIRNVRNPVREIGSRYKKAHEVLIVDEVEVTKAWSPGRADLEAFVESYLTEDDLESEKKNTKKREREREEEKHVSVHVEF